MFIITCIGASAQTYYKCTSNDVFIRQGPGKNYAPVCYSGARGSDPNDPYMLSEGEIVKSRGAAKNGYIPVQEVGGGGTIWWFEGWVSAQSLTRATRCVSCKGILM